MNILLVVADDLRPVLGCYGDPIARTPNIDRLARRGVVFRNAYCQAPVCGPSRVSFLSGLRPETTGCVGWNPNPGLLYMPKWFRQRGHLTAGFGKVFHAGRVFTRYEIEQFQREGRPLPHGFSYPYDGDTQSAAEKLNPRIWNPPDCWDRYEFCNTPDDLDGYGYAYSAALRSEGYDCGLLQERNVVFRGSLRPMELVNGSFWHEWAALNISDERTSDGLAARRAAAAMEEATHLGQPFFVAAGFRRPHEILCAPKPYFDLYAAADTTPAAEPREHVERLSQVSLTYPKHLAYHIYTDPERGQWCAYYACVSFLDANVGVLLDALDRLNAWNDTTVVLLSDNGLHHGEHGGLSNKLTAFEESARVPLIVAAPGMHSAGSTSGRPVELVDLFPTLTDLCGTGLPGPLDGTSLRPLLTDPEAVWTKPACSIVNKQLLRDPQGRGVIKNDCDDGGPFDFDGPPRKFFGRTIRTQRYRYTAWDDGRLGAELYDEENDPPEYVNLAGRPEYAQVESMMGQALARLSPVAAPPPCPAE